jgi:hypothetical protein
LTVRVNVVLLSKRPDPEKVKIVLNPLLGNSDTQKWTSVGLQAKDSDITITIIQDNDSWRLPWRQHSIALTQPTSWNRGFAKQR